MPEPSLGVAKADRSRPGLPIRAVVAIYALVLALLGAVPFLARSEEVPPADLMRDVFSIGGIPIYSGLLSNAGVFLWCASAAVASFAALLVDGEEPPLGRFLAASAGMSTLFMVDDFFMLHEWVAPRFLGWSEDAAYVLYGCLFAFYAIRYRDLIRALAPGFFGFATVALAISVGIDLLHAEERSAWGYYVEEGVKLMGIGTWVAFVASASVSAVRRSTR